MWPQFSLAGLCCLLRQICFWALGKGSKSREVLSPGRGTNLVEESFAQLTSCQPSCTCLQRSSDEILQRQVCMGFICLWTCVWEPVVTEAQRSLLEQIFRHSNLQNNSTLQNRCYWKLVLIPLLFYVPTVLIPTTQNIGDSSFGMFPEAVINYRLKKKKGSSYIWLQNCIAQLLSTMWFFFFLWNNNG